MYFVIVGFIACICYLYFYYLYIYYLCIVTVLPMQIAFTAFFYLNIVSVIFVMLFMLLWCFDFELFHFQLSVHRCWICETNVCVCVFVRA